MISLNIINHINICYNNNIIYIKIMIIFILHNASYEYIYILL